MSEEAKQDDEQAKDDGPKDDGPKPVRPLNPFQLDLNVEEVEERISPGETNVFDK